MEKITKKEVKRDWKSLNFSVPITQSMRQDGKFLIEGIAINSTTTRNGTTFLSEELEKSAPSLRNKPILKDHDNSVDSIVGRTTQNVDYNKLQQNVQFEANIQDGKMQEMISDGRISSVSIGATVTGMEETEEGDVILRGIDFVELSLVAVPADPHAGFAARIAESFELYKEKKSKETSSFSEDNKVEEELKKLQKENAEFKQEKLDAEAKEKFEEEVSKRVAEEKVKLEEEYKKEDIKPTIKEEVEDETKGEVEDVKEESSGEETSFVLETTGGKASFYSTSYDPKYKNLQG